MILGGKVGPTTHNDDGSAIESVVLCQEDGLCGADIPKGVWDGLATSPPAVLKSILERAGGLEVLRGLEVSRRGLDVLRRGEALEGLEEHSVIIECSQGPFVEREVEVMEVVLFFCVWEAEGVKNLTRADKAEWAGGFAIGLSARGEEGSVARYRHCTCSGERGL